jgi:hypothetical protein
VSTKLLSAADEKTRGCELETESRLSPRKR